MPAEWDRTLKMVSPYRRPDLRPLGVLCVSTAGVLLTVSCFFLQGEGKGEGRQAERPCG